MASGPWEEYQDAGPWSEYAKEPERRRTMVEELRRQAALGLRSAIQGPAKFAGLFVDPFVQLAGGRPTAQRVGEQLTRWGLPQPETDNEQLAAAVNEAVVGGAPITKAAQMAAQGAQWVPPMVRQIAAAPGAEIASNAVGAGASEWARQAGAPWWAQAAAGAAAPLGVSAVNAVGGAVGRGVNELRRPLTKAGAEQVAADAIGRMTSDKTSAIDNLSQYAALKELERRSGKHLVGVPGSQPEAAAVAADYGLIGARRAVARGDAAPDFAAQAAKNNAARLDDLARLGATEQQIAAYELRRDAVTAGLRNRAFAGAKGPIDYAPVEARIAALASTPQGGRQETSRALAILQKWVQDRKDAGRVRPEDAYELHKDINDLIRGRVNDDKGVVRLSAGMATEVKQVLADAIDQQAPGFRKYLKTYERLTRPIERLQVISDKLGGQDLSKVTNAMPLVTPEGAGYALSQAKLRNALPAIEAETRLAPRQSDILRRNLGELNADVMASRGGAQPGSDTYQNIAAANLVNRVLGRTLAEAGGAKMAQGPLNLLLRPLEARIQEIQARAFQDPELMLELLKKSRTQRESPTLAGVLDFSAPRASGGLLGALLAQ